MPSSLFTYEELTSATDGFSDANLLGEGGFGYVHKGTLSNGKEVAVKQLKPGSEQGEKEFRSEVEIIGRVHHKHLVSLLGYCLHGKKRLLVYEFVPNDTLALHLHGLDRPTMDWSTRLRIAIGAAKGIAYLHEDCSPRVIHRDIKPSNILVDFKFEPKVADFGLAKLFLDEYTHVTTRIMGTLGYLAPEYASSGIVTEKSDVFSYGMVLLELITGQRAITSIITTIDGETSLVEWASPLLHQALEDGCFESIVDGKLHGNYDSAGMTRLVACAAACIQSSAKQRPCMSQVARVLEGTLAIENMIAGLSPYKKPDHALGLFGSSSESSPRSSRKPSKPTSGEKRTGRVPRSGESKNSKDLSETPTVDNCHQLTK